MIIGLMPGGVIRIYFTAADLGRVRLAGQTDEMWEIVLSLHMLQTRDLPLIFDGWRRRSGQAIRARDITEDVSGLTALNPASNYFPDFLTPVGYGGGLVAGIDAVRSTPAWRLRAELSRVRHSAALPGWTHLLAAGDGDAVSHLCHQLRLYHHTVMAPFQPYIDHQLARVRERHLGHLATGGTESLLASLGPWCTWTPPVLRAPYPFDRDLHLEGRGLLLVPSFFCARYPVTFCDRELQPVLVYPITHDPRWTGDPADSAATGLGSLRNLIGDTRVRILELTATTSFVTSGTLARRLHLSAPTVSHHTRIMRDTGLIHTVRDGQTVVHNVTSLGIALLTNTFPEPHF